MKQKQNSKSRQQRHAIHEANIKFSAYCPYQTLQLHGLPMHSSIFYINPRTNSFTFLLHLSVTRLLEVQM